MREEEQPPPKSSLDDDLSRIGVAVPAVLLEQFDRLIARKGYPSRSEAFRDLMRDVLNDDAIGNLNGEAVGTLTLVYDHHVRRLNDRLVGTQHQHYDQIVSTIHLHLDHNNCLEVVIFRGHADDIQKVADSLIATKGVRHGKLTLTAATG